ncbi:NlpC/P60 family protein [Streptomyces sp. URMC 123]|uniref:C40 family peptidase n=1 Tax=Streptomyces sp. URMC 123 TaxID=3423403 RepID=UPI003F1D446B
MSRHAKHAKRSARRSPICRAVHPTAPAAGRRPEAVILSVMGRVSALSLLGLLSVMLGAVLALQGPAAADTPHTNMTTAPAPRTPHAAQPHLPIAPGEPAPNPGLPPVPKPERPKPELPKPELPKQPAPKPKDPGTPKPKPNQKPKPGPKAPQQATREITVRWGDTLSTLATRHHTTVVTLQRLNQLGASTLIYAGQTLLVPTGKDKAPGGKERKPRSPQRPPAGKDRAAKAVAFAHAQLGKPYVWGATGPNAYDCSGLTQAAWKAAGVHIDRTTWQQITNGKTTTRAQLVPGDLVISNGGRHVAIYIGGGQVIHAPGRGKTVRIASLPRDVVEHGYRHIV